MNEYARPFTVGQEIRIGVPHLRKTLPTGSKPGNHGIITEVDVYGDFARVQIDGGGNYAFWLKELLPYGEEDC